MRFRPCLLASIFCLVCLNIQAENTAIAHTRTLAASCAACHGTHGQAQGNGFVLAGLDKTYFATQMLAFKEGKRPATVMHRHAKGLNIEEINALADYFSVQTPQKPLVLKSQMLGKNHE